MEALHTGILSIAVMVILVPIAFIWYVAGGGIYLAVKKALRRSRHVLTCHIDADCPPGHICVDGRCVSVQ